MRWTIRGIGLLSTAILARLLAPSDFGLVAMATLTAGLVETFLSFGVETALIQQQARSREDLDSAWTLRLLQGLTVATLIVLATPFAVEYFGDPRLEPILWTMACGTIIGSLGNIGVVMFRADLQFDREYRFMVLKKLVVFVTVVSAAFMLRNYWALVLGTLAGTVCATLLSYWMHPYRPRLGTRSIRKLWSFSQWMLVTNIGYYIESRIDEVVVGGNTDARQLGLYSMSSEVALLPTAEIAMPISRALVPGYAKLQADQARLAAAFLNVFGMVFLIALPAGCGLALVADHAVHLVLGEQWSEIVPLVQILAIHGAIRVSYSAIANLFMATGQIRFVASMNWLGMGIFGFTAVMVIGTYGLAGVAIAKVAVTLLVFIVASLALWHSKRISPLRLAERMYRPILGAGGMVAAISQLPAISPELSIVDFLFKIATGASVFVMLVGLLWTAAGRPSGAESFVHEKLQQQITSQQKIMRRKFKRRPK